MKKTYLYSLLAALLLAVVAILFFAPDAIEGNVLQQSDIRQGLANGQEAKAFHEATGETTRWTNSLFSGMPNFQIAPSYPADSMLGWIAKVYMLGLPSPSNLLFGMMVGFFIMCLCMKIKWPTALFGALAWGLSTYFIIIIGAGHIWKFLTLCYIPPTIGGIALLYRGKYVGGTALASLLGALQLQSNHPQMSYYFMFVIIFMVFAWGAMAWRKKEWKRWGIATFCMCLAGVIALGAASPSLYNSYEYSKETIRGKATALTTPGNDTEASGLDIDYITAWSYGIDETWTLLIPNVKGGATIKPRGGNNELMSLADTPEGEKLSVDQNSAYFLSQFPQYFGEQPMTNGPVYVGAFVLLLAILSLLVCNGPMIWALFAVSILAILLSWGHNFIGFTRFFVENFPAYDKFRTVSSILVIVEFTIPLMAVICLKKILDTKDFFARYAWQFYCVMGLGALVCIIGWLAPSAFGDTLTINENEMLSQQGLMQHPDYAYYIAQIRQVRLSLVSADSLRSLLFILLGAGLTWIYLKGYLNNKVVFVCGLSLIVLVDLFSVNKRYVNEDNFVGASSASTLFTPTKADQMILQDTASNYRVMDINGMGDARGSYFHKMIGGYHAAKLTRYNDLLSNKINKMSPGVLNMLNTKYFIVSPDSVVMNPDAYGNAWFVDKVDYVKGANAEMAALDNTNLLTTAVTADNFKSILGNSAPQAPGDTIYLTYYSPNRLTYHASTGKKRVAVFSEVYFPWGWTATIDGQETPIAQVDYVLRAISVPQGSHTIEFRFDPKSLKVTNGISITSIIIIYLLCIGALVIWWMGIQKKKPEDTN